MPKLHSSRIPRERFFMDYINTYLERDIHDLEQVGKLSLPIKPALVLCMADELVPYKRDVWLCPVSLI